MIGITALLEIIGTSWAVSRFFRIIDAIERK